MKENEWLDQLMNDMKKLEDAQHPEVPQKHEMMSAISDFKKQSKKALKRELALFIFTALAMLSAFFVVTLRMPGVFLWVQLFPIIMIPIIFSAEKKRRSDEVSEDGF